MYCKYQSGNFSDIKHFWKTELNAKFEDIGENVSMMILDKNTIEKMIQVESIPVDCRIFAFLYSQLTIEGACITILNSRKGLDCIIPEDCYYLSLSKNINEKIKGIELRYILNDTQGQWIYKISDDKYIGINSKGILTLTIDEWFDVYNNSVENKLEFLSKNKSELSSIADKVFAILSIKIKQKGLQLSLFKFGIAGENSVIKTFCKNKNFQTLL